MSSPDYCKKKLDEIYNEVSVVFNVLEKNKIFCKKFAIKFQHIKDYCDNYINRTKRESHE